MTDGMLLREFLGEPDLAGYRFVPTYNTLYNCTLLLTDLPILSCSYIQVQ